MVVFGGGGGLSIYEGISALFHPRTLTLLWPNYLVIGLAAVFESVSLAIGIREFGIYRRERRFGGSMLSVMRASKNPAIFVTVLEDSAALIGLALAAAGLTLRDYLGVPAIDGVASILIGLVLVAEAGLLGRECRGLIIGEAARPLVIAEVRRLLARHPEVGRVDEMRTLQLGPDSVLSILGIRSEAGMDVAEMDRIRAQLAAEIRKVIPTITNIAYDVEPNRRRPPSPNVPSIPSPGQNTSS